ncbi:MAG: hypothetical protein OH363_05625, partial [Candidatus Parvarchaeota archaeon]|nr:hypothetical protein [Candidatus Jingweiarchaeum tengchongense]
MKIGFSRLVLFLTALIMFMSFIPRSFGLSSFFLVELEDNHAGAVSGYRIFLSGLETSFKADRLIISFPEDTSSVYLQKDSSPDLEYKVDTSFIEQVTVNGIHIESLSIRQVFDKLQYIINLSDKLTLSKEIEIVLPREAGIINPTMPRDCYTLNVNFYLGNSLIISIPSSNYKVIRSAIKEVQVLEKLPKVGATSNIDIMVTLGVNGYLTKNADSVYLSFPSSFRINKSSIFNKNFLVNGLNPAAVYMRSDISGNTIELVPARDISPFFDKVLSISIAEGVIYNPSVPGKFSIRVS